MGSLIEGALGPITEARFSDAFSKGALATLKAAAELVGLDEKTLKAMTVSGVIQGTPRGRLVGYSEMALRAYLLNPMPISSPEEKVTCQSTSRRKAASGTTTSSTKAVGFMAQRALRLAARPTRSSAR